MDVRVMHGSTNITHHVIRYDREHKICTGIGMLELEVDYTYNGTFDPWDKIVIYEEDWKAGTYYVSGASEGQPNATIVVSAQDNSKRLSDYFIAESYMIDYPSYSRFWIEYFLNEVGVSYNFLVTDAGSLLSNNTALGLMSAYDQIMMLLQMSGWYITFTADGVAKIGKANVGFGTGGISLNNRDIIEVKVDKNDRLYRNRVVVWGNGDPDTNRWVYADVSKPSKWDYDSKDRRTIVISNSNIPSVADAFALANKALIEFARISVEKYVTVTGAREVEIGDVVKLNTRIFTGSGLTTTLGSSLSRSGLVTNIALDERCPRLFGFYNMDGFVYVGTYGSGVWRKLTNPTWSGGSTTGSGLIGFASGIYNYSGWYDYSTGLGDMAVTDLHVNNGLLASVTASGQAYYSIEEGLTTASGMDVWSGIPIPTLYVVYSGVAVQSGVYTSGVMARACIIDRDTNFVKIALDTRSGVNLGDFLMETDPLNTYPLFSYDPPGTNYTLPTPPWSGLDMKAWVMDINAYSGLVNGIHSVNTSGNFNYYVYDIDNDGTNDYVEAMTLLSGIMPVSVSNGIYENANNTYSWAISTPELNLGSKTTADYRTNTYMPYSGYIIPELQNVDSVTIGITEPPSFIMGPVSFYDFMPTCSGYVVYCNERDVIIPRDRRDYSIDEIFYNHDDPINPYLQTRHNVVTKSGLQTTGDVIAIIKDNTTPTDRLFNFFELNPAEHKIYKTQINVDNLSISTTTHVDSVPVAGAGNLAFSEVIIGNRLISVSCDSDISYGFSAYLNITSLLTGNVEHRKIFSKEGTGLTVDTSEVAYQRPRICILPHEDNEFRIIIPYLEVSLISGSYPHPERANVKVRRWIDSGSDSEILDWSASHGQVAYPQDINDLFSDYGLAYLADPIIPTYGCFSADKQYCVYSIGVPSFAGSPGFLIEPDSQHQITDMYTNYSITEGDWSSPIYQYKEIYSIRGNTLLSSGTLYEAVGKLDDDTIWYINALTGEPSTEVVVPNLDITLYQHLDVRDSFNGEHYYRADYGIPGTPGNPFIVVAVNKFNQVTRMREGGSPPYYIKSDLFGNFTLNKKDLFGNERSVTYTVPAIIHGTFPEYQLLQRTDDDFVVVKSGIYRDRVEISQYSPIVTMDRRVSSLETYYISPDGNALQVTHSAMSGYNLGNNSASVSVMQEGILGDDYRYSYFDDVVESGTMGKLLVVFSGGVGYTDLTNLSAFSGVYLNTGSGVVQSGIPAGYATRIEISNYQLPDQFTFVSVSGYSIMSGIQLNDGFGFYQKDPMSGVWVDYSSGYPQARTTIIRLDDRL